MKHVLFILTLLALSLNVGFAQITVTAVSPANSALNVSPATTIQVTFSDMMLTSTFNDSLSFTVRGMTSGKHHGSFGFTGGNMIATFTPTVPFENGEIVFVDISSNLQNASSVAITPFVYSFTVVAAVAPGTFPAKTDYATGSNPYSIFVSDIDGDGDGDIATANGTGSVSILKNNGNGTYAANVDYTAGSYPTSVFISDLDGDGDGDLAVTNYSSHNVSILKNNGDGTFAAKVDYPAGYYAYSVFVSDIDGDGDGDLAVAGRGLATVSILMNNGDGTFATPVSYAAAGDPTSVFISDLDGDGDGDLVVAGFGPNTLSILKNNGDGTFAAHVDYPAGNGPFYVFVSDLDGDGDGDLAVSNPGGLCCGAPHLSILKNNGNGTFAPRVDYPVGYGIGSLFVSDVDGDGDGDLAFVNNDTYFSIMKNNGDGTFAANIGYPTGNYGTYSVFVSDVDSDGDGDIAVANSGSNNVSIFKNGFSLIVNATNGSVTKNPDQTSYNPGAQVELTALPAVGYQFVNWSGNASGSTNPLIMTMDDNKDITANFDIITLTVNIVGNGNVVKTPDQLSYEYGSTVQLEAIPALGYLFDGWSDDASGITNPIDVVMDNDKTVTATFIIDPDYEAMYRTATYSDWATAVDGKGKYKAVKRKNDKVFLKFNIGAPANSTGFALKFNMNVNGAVTIGKTKTVQLGDAILNANTAIFSGLTIAQGDTFQFDGFGLKGKIASVKVVWQTSPKPTTQTITSFKFNTPKLPMPNLHNVGTELFPGGFGQVGSYFTNGLFVGIPQGVKGGNSVIHLKYKDVQKSLVKIAHGIPQFHADSIRCLDTFTVTRKPISKQQKSLPPNKGKNILFAELLTLKLNVAASATGKFPAGLGELTFDDATDPLNPLNGQMISTIVQKADTIISCLPLTSKPVPPTLAELYNVLHKINGAFSGAIDTFSFSMKTQMTGVKQLIDVPFLRKTPGVEPVVIPSSDLLAEEVPAEFRLEQNYPNPFNPSTTIRFSLPTASLVTLTVYNTLGQEVANLLNGEEYDFGAEEVEFIAGNLASGIYYYRLVITRLDENDEVSTGESLTRVMKMMLVK